MGAVMQIYTNDELMECVYETCRSKLEVLRMCT